MKASLVYRKRIKKRIKSCFCVLKLKPDKSAATQRLSVLRVLNKVPETGDLETQKCIPVVPEAAGSQVMLR